MTQAGAVISGLNISGTVYIRRSECDAGKLPNHGGELRRCPNRKWHNRGRGQKPARSTALAPTTTARTGSPGRARLSETTFTMLRTASTSPVRRRSRTTTSTGCTHPARRIMTAFRSMAASPIRRSATTRSSMPNDQTSAIMIDNYFGPISNISVDGNLLVGGGYTVYSDAQFTGGSITGVSVTNNHIGGGHVRGDRFQSEQPGLYRQHQ